MSNCESSGQKDCHAVHRSDHLAYVTYHHSTTPSYTMNIQTTIRLRVRPHLDQVVGNLICLFIELSHWARGIGLRPVLSSSLFIRWAQSVTVIHSESNILICAQRMSVFLDCSQDYYGLQTAYTPGL